MVPYFVDTGSFKTSDNWTDTNLRLAMYRGPARELAKCIYVCSPRYNSHLTCWAVPLASLHPRGERRGNVLYNAS